MYLDDLMITKQVILAVAGRIFSVLFRCYSLIFENSHYNIFIFYIHGNLSHKIYHKNTKAWKSKYT